MVETFRGSRLSLTVQALVIFVLIDFGLFVLGFPRICRLVRLCGGGSTPAAPTRDQRFAACEISKAVQTATRYYWRRRLDCLPRALATYLLLRRRGVPATLHIGVRRFPFAAHAWVECLGKVYGGAANAWLHEPYKPIISL